MNTINTLDRTQAPHIKDAIEFHLHLKPYQKMVLDNGVEVYTIDAGIEDLLQLEWVFFSGNWYEEQNGIAAATNHLLKNGTTAKSAFEINDHFDYYGAYLNRSCYNETATISLHTLNRHLPELLPVVSEIIMEASFPAQELEIYQQNMKQRLEVNLLKCDFVANRKIDECLYGLNHPYGKYSTAETYNLLKPESLRQFHQQYYKNGRCIMFVAGKLPSDIYQQLNTNFGKLPIHARTSVEITHPIVRATEKKYNIVNDPNGVQAAIRIARPSINRLHPDFTKAQVLNTIFGGFFGSRLMSNIREDKGYTYGIHSFFQNHLSESAWMISTEAGKDVLEATIKEVYYEMQVLREELVEDDELLLVKNYLIGTVLGDLDGPFQIIGRWKNIILNNLTGAYFDNSIQTIKDITPKDIQEMAEKYLKPEEFYELVVV